jgi:16S rRNA (uracil1498-N3)-methyltransferase
VAGLASTAEVARLVGGAALAAVLHEEASVPLASLDVPASGDLVVVVGPEGGIAPAELESFEVEPVRLGDTVLRTSTAGVAASSVCCAEHAGSDPDQSNRPDEWSRVTR